MSELLSLDQDPRGEGGGLRGKSERRRAGTPILTWKSESTKHG